jgi:polyferredoxin
MSFTMPAMLGNWPFQLLADAVLALHVAVVLFVIGGLAAVVMGNLRGWRWVNAMGFRLAHLVAIAVVAAQAWLGLVCPLTSLEMWLRARAGGPVYGGSFVQHWLQSLLYFNAPGWVFTLAYTAFGALVALTWLRFPPKRRYRRHA